MSRIGKLKIKLPNEIEVKKNTKDTISVKGKFGELIQSYPNDKLEIEIEDAILKVNLKDTSRETKALQGLYRTLLNNMVLGVTKRFEKTLEINGVGYRAQVQGNKIILSLGYSHPIEFQIPENIEVKIEGNFLTIIGISKEKVGLFTSQIRSKRPPEPYKGKGIRYRDEVIIRKVGKSGKK